MASQETRTQELAAHEASEPDPPAAARTTAAAAAAAAPVVGVEGDDDEEEDDEDYVPSDDEADDEDEDEDNEDDEDEQEGDYKQDTTADDTAAPTMTRDAPAAGNEGHDGEMEQGGASPATIALRTRRKYVVTDLEVADLEAKLPEVEEPWRWDEVDDAELYDEFLRGVRGELPLDDSSSSDDESYIPNEEDFADFEGVRLSPQSARRAGNIMSTPLRDAHHALYAGLMQPDDPHAHPAGQLPREVADLQRETEEADLQRAAKRARVETGACVPILPALHEPGTPSRLRQWRNTPNRRSCLYFTDQQYGTLQSQITRAVQLCTQLFVCTLQYTDLAAEQQEFLTILEDFEKERRRARPPDPLPQTFDGVDAPATGLGEMPSILPNSIQPSATSSGEFPTCLNQPILTAAISKVLNSTQVVRLKTRPLGDGKRPKALFSLTMSDDATAVLQHLGPHAVAELVPAFRQPPSATAQFGPSSRLNFTPSEDALLAIAMKRFGNDDFRAIQKVYFPLKNAKQLMIRLKNRATSKAPDNPLKAYHAAIKENPVQWTSEELLALHQAALRTQNDWAVVSKLYLPHRGPTHIEAVWKYVISKPKHGSQSKKTSAGARLPVQPSPNYRTVEDERAIARLRSTVEEREEIDSIADTDSDDDEQKGDAAAQPMQLVAPVMPTAPMPEYQWNKASDQTLLSLMQRIDVNSEEFVQECRRLLGCPPVAAKQRVDFWLRQLQSTSATD